VLAVVSTVGVLIAFALTTLRYEPGTAVAIVLIVGLSIAIDVLWKRRSSARRVQLSR
jgi:hypothetical protein